ncbi:putative leader peptide [Streptomyces sp. NBC_00704]
MVAQAQALNFSSRRHVDLRRVSTAVCRPAV